MKGFGTDEKALIRVLSNKDPLQIDLLRNTFDRNFKRDLIKDIKSETSSWFEKALVQLARGPLLTDVHGLYDAMAGPGTKEVVLNDILLSRSNADMKAIKSAYRQKFHKSLEDAVKGDLSMKTERHFLMVLSANRAEDAAPVIPQQVDDDVMQIYKATEGKMGTDELLVCSILSYRNDNQIRAIAHSYKQRFNRDLEKVIKSVGLNYPGTCPQLLVLTERKTGILRAHARRASFPAASCRGQVHARRDAPRGIHGWPGHQGSPPRLSRRPLPLGPEHAGQRQGGRPAKVRQESRKSHQGRDVGRLRKVDAGVCRRHVGYLGHEGGPALLTTRVDDTAVLGKAFRELQPLGWAQEPEIDSALTVDTTASLPNTCYNDVSRRNRSSMMMMGSGLRIAEATRRWVFPLEQAANIDESSIPTRQAIEWRNVAHSQHWKVREYIEDPEPRP